MEKEYPKHVALILDGNRRWAKAKGLPPLKGHQAGFDNICNLVPYMIHQGVEVVTVYAFSTENFKRSQEEVSYLMDLFVRMFHEKCKDLNQENIKVVVSGRRELLRSDVQEAIVKGEEMTSSNTGGIFNVCLAYGGQQEIVDACKKVYQDMRDGKLSIDSLNEENFYHYLYQDLPPVDFMIRTSGETRLSNFLLYQLSYAELYFIPIGFPDFHEEEFEKAIDSYLQRDRRFGGNSNK